MQAAIVCATGVTQQFRIEAVVFIGMETRLSIVAALGDMLRDTRNIEAGRAWQVTAP
jgi:hypothetical protein